MWVALALERSVAGADVTAEDEMRPKQVNQSLLTVLIAFLANLLIAICEVLSLPRSPRRRRCWLRAASWAEVCIRQRRAATDSDHTWVKAHDA